MHVHLSTRDKKWQCVHFHRRVPIEPYRKKVLGRETRRDAGRAIRFDSIRCHRSIDRWDVDRSMESNRWNRRIDASIDGFGVDARVPSRRLETVTRDSIRDGRWTRRARLAVVAVVAFAYASPVRSYGSRRSSASHDARARARRRRTRPRSVVGDVGGVGGDEER